MSMWITLYASWIRPLYYWEPSLKTVTILLTIHLRWPIEAERHHMATVKNFKFLTLDLNSLWKFHSYEYQHAYVSVSGWWSGCWVKVQLRFTAAAPSLSRCFVNHWLRLQNLPGLYGLRFCTGAVKSTYNRIHVSIMPTDTGMISSPIHQQA